MLSPKAYQSRSCHVGTQGRNQPKSIRTTRPNSTFETCARNGPPVSPAGYPVLFRGSPRSKRRTFHSSQLLTRKAKALRLDVGLVRIPSEECSPSSVRQHSQVYAADAGRQRGYMDCCHLRAQSRLAQSIARLADTGGRHQPTAPCDGVGAMALIPQAVDAVRLPVIAAGEIGDGWSIAAVFALGASP